MVLFTKCARLLLTFALGESPSMCRAGLAALQLNERVLRVNLCVQKLLWQKHSPCWTGVATDSTNVALANKGGGGVWSRARGHDGGVGVALGLVARLGAASRRCGGPLLGRTQRRPGVALRQRFFGERNFLEQRHNLPEPRRAAPRGATSSFESSMAFSNKSFSTSSAPRLDAMVSSSASEIVRLSERYTLLARSASELLPLLEMRDGVLSELNWRDGVLRATGRGFASLVASLVNAPAKETRMRSRTASGVAYR